MVGVLLELQRRIPDRWLLRRLLPAALFVAIAMLGKRLGLDSWGDIGSVQQRLTAYLSGLRGGQAYSAQIVLFVLLTVACALVVPAASSSIGAFAAGDWPWWLAPFERRIRAMRSRYRRRVRSAALRAKDEGRELRSALLKGWAETTLPSEPTTAPWIGDRLAVAANAVATATTVDVRTSWAEFLLRLSEGSRTALSAAVDGYDAACEALSWSGAFAVLGLWWWPGFLIGLILWFGSWRWLRRAAVVLADVAEAVSRVYEG
jgi:hypothetical protein